MEVFSVQPYTVKEAAAKLRLSAASVYALCAARKLRHQRVGVGRGKIVIPHDAIDEYLARATVNSADAPPQTRDIAGQKGLKTFANLDSARLLAAWKKQGRT
jgi:excisionase family DNA binding protein